jgi:hypothetical protein
MDGLLASPISLLGQMRREVVGRQLGRRDYVLWLLLQLLTRVVCCFFSFHRMSSFLYAILWPPADVWSTLDLFSYLLNI